MLYDGWKTDFDHWCSYIEVMQRMNEIEARQAKRFILTVMAVLSCASAGLLAYAWWIGTHLG
jgi:hypothetical protein